MLHRINAVCHQAKFARAPCAWLAIDDVPIEVWLEQHLGDLANSDSPSLLGLSLMWLTDEHEQALAERRFEPGEDGTSTLVPLLVCSDDMDFACTVLMAEQVVEGETIQWRRFGWSGSGGLEVGVFTRWLADSQPVTFALSDFKNALVDLNQLLGKCSVSEGDD